MNRYADMVRLTVERYLKDPEDVKECVNDTFMEFYRTRDNGFSGAELISSPGSPLPSNCFELPVYMPEDREELAQARLCLNGTISLLWAHEFEIPFTVE